MSTSISLRLIGWLRPLHVVGPCSADGQAVVTHAFQHGSYPVLGSLCWDSV